MFFVWISQSLNWSKEKIDETRRQSDKVRDLCTLAEKLGCSATQLSIAWTLKHEPVQCLLLGATTAEQLHQSLQSLQVQKLKRNYNRVAPVETSTKYMLYNQCFKWNYSNNTYMVLITTKITLFSGVSMVFQLLPRLSTSVMLEMERILDNKPVRPPAISTLALR